MEILRRTFTQFRDLYQAMSPSQRGTLLVVPALIIAAMGLLMYTAGERSEEFLLAGKFFSPEELTRAQEALRTAGLAEFRQDGQRIAVPRRDVEKYEAALVVRGSMPADFSADFDKMQEKIGMFTSNTQRREMMEEARKHKLSRVLRAIPDIEEAIVEWDRPEPTGLFRKIGTLTATVSVKTRGGKELTPQLINSLRLFVASAVHDLSPDHVTVTDLNTGIASVPNKDGDPYSDRFVELTRQRTTEYESKIRQHLADIPGVIVTVNVELDNLKTSTEREQKIDPKPFALQSNTQTRTQQSQQKPVAAEPGVANNQPRSLRFSGGVDRHDTVEETQETAFNAASVRHTEKVFEGLQPKSVQVAVKIPDDFYRAVAIKRGQVEGTTADEKKEFQRYLDSLKKATEDDVRRQVATLIPAGSLPDSISVTGYARLDYKPPVIATPLLTTATEVFNQWGGAAGLALFALWALWMLNKSMSKLPAEPASLAAAPNPGGEDDLDDGADQAPPPATKRDELQAMVRDNPEMAASVLSRWIAPAK
jgi:flagellar M-ring protein FliF